LRLYGVLSFVFAMGVIRTTTTVTNGITQSQRTEHHHRVVMKLHGVVTNSNARLMSIKLQTNTQPRKCMTTQTKQQANQERQSL